MERRLTTLFVALFCAALLAPHWNRVARLIPERGLHGVVERAPAPTFSWDGLRSGSFQAATEARVNQRLSLRGWLVQLDASLTYALTRETPKGSGVIVGEHGVLFPDSDVAFFNQPEPVAEEELHRTARLVGEVQRALASRGKLLVLVVVPSKSSIWPDAIPPGWRRELPEPRPCDVTYRRLVEALRQEEVLFVDARALLTGAEERWGERAFPPGGRHWSERAACEVLRELGRVASPGLSSPVPPLACEPLPTRDDPADSDHDLRNLMNVRELPARPSPVVQIAGESREEGLRRPTVLYVGTSFFWKLLPVALKGGVFQESDYYYYNSKHHRFQGDLPVVPVVPHSDGWRERTLSRDLIVVDAAEMFLPMVGSGFLEQLRDELAEPQSEAAGPF